MQSGVIVSVLEKTRFEYTYLTSGSPQQLIVLQRSINVSSFYHVQLIVRVHERSFSGNQNLTFNLNSTLPSEEDSREFTTATNFISLPVTSTSPAAGSNIVSASASDPGAFLKLSLYANQDSATPGTFYAELSAVLVLRQA